MRLQLLFTLFLIPFSLVFGQPPKAKKAFDTALQDYLVMDYARAIKSLDKAIKEYPQYAGAIVLRADCYRESKDTAAAIRDYKAAAEIDPDRFPSVLYSVGFLSFLQADYNTAFAYLSRYLSEHPQPGSSNKSGEAYFYLRHAEYAKDAVLHPIELNEKKLSLAINTEWDEYANDISLDGQTLYFTRKQPAGEGTASGRNMQEDFYRTILLDGEWAAVEKLPSPLNSGYDEGALDVSADGTIAIFASNRPGAQGRFDLFFSLWQGDHWGEVLNLGPSVNSGYWDSQPSLSSDGRTLYFVSDRPGGKGGSDIWYSQLQDDGSWTLAKNLGYQVNSQYNEMTPVIHPDGKTLYFASEFHPGFGRFDLFVTRLEVDGTWSEPVNLGYPLNTSMSEFTFVIHPNGHLAFFSRYDRLKGMEIVQIDLPSYAQPNPITYVKGRILDDLTGKPLEAAFRLIDLETGDTIVRSFSEKRLGAFLVTLPSNRNYGLFAECPGYMFHSENFRIEGEHSYDKPYSIEIRLKKLGEGSVVLRNVFFDVDKYQLKAESYLELDKFVAFMKTNPKLKAEVGGHTDNTGSPEHNVILSSNRAKAVYEYLVSKGVSADRLSYQGYGTSQPIADNDTEVGRASNRRTEVNFKK
jgi:hypothetical protein